MYLHLTHNCFAGKYAEFSRWKVALAIAAGYPLPKFASGFPSYLIPWETLPEGIELGNWGRWAPEEPLIMLFVHEYNRGHIKPREARQLIPRLEELLPNMEDKDRETTEQFIDGLKAAVALNERVEFH